MNNTRTFGLTMTQWLTILLVGLFFNGYTQQLVVKDPTYTLLTPFVPMSGDKANVFQIALGQVKTDKNNYVLLLENHINDFSLDIIDTTHLVDILMKAYTVKSRNGSTWMEEIRLTLPVFKKSVPSNSKGILIALSLTGTDAYDLKGQMIGDFVIHEIDNSGKYRSETKSQVSIKDPAKKFFITYSSKITTSKGSFDDISKFKTNKIVFYSLFSKNMNLVNEKLGTPIKSEQENATTINSYETPLGHYNIEFKDNRSTRIEFVPKIKIKYIGKLFILESYPLEITGCNCGEFSSKETSGSFGDKQEYGIIYTFKDKSAHRISFKSDGVKYLEKVVAEDY